MNCAKCDHMGTTGDPLTGQLLCDICDKPNNGCTKCGYINNTNELLCKTCDINEQEVYFKQEIQYDEEFFSDESELPHYKYCYFL